MADDALAGTVADGIRQQWQKQLPSEVAFWRKIVSGEFDNAQWVENMRLRTAGRALWPDYLSKYLVEGRATRILDVGAGPHSSIGPVGAPSEIAVEAVDPLADDYAEMLAAQGITPFIPTRKGDAERLSDYGYADFDLVYSRNALDHAYDPLAALKEMIGVCRVGGVVFLEGTVNEGKRNNYQGLHNWNFMPQPDGDLSIWNRSTEHSARAELGEAVTIRASGGEMYRAEMRRIA
jgi:SAM-dependent methyltransferase